MDQKTLVRAWRDPVFRSNLPPAELRELPDHPAGGAVEESTDWGERLGVISIGEACMITLGGGCGSAGCTQIICTDPCMSTGESCKPKPATETQACTDNGVCP